MTADVHALAGAYSLHALPSDELAFFERHLTVCEVCRRDVDVFTGTAARLGTAVSEEPPHGLRRRVLTDITRTEQLPAAGVASTPPRSTRPDGRSLLAAVAGVLAVALLALSGVAIQMNQRMADFEAALPSVGLDTRALAVLAAPDAETRLLEAGQGVTARFVYSTELNRAVFVAHGLEPLPADRAYELWLFHDGTPQPASVFEGDSQGRALTVVDGLVAGAEFAAVTVEPAGGSPRPTGEMLIHGSV